MLILYSFMESLNSFLLTLDGWVYSFINTLYKVFLVLSRISLFGEDDIAPFIRRVYMIIGVVMLFLLSYSLLTNIVNPEGKGKDSAGKTIFNVVKAVILLALVPTIFDFAYQIQDAILSHNTIGKIILGTGEKYTGTAANGDPKTPESILNDGGINMAMGVLQAFIVPTENKSAENTQIEGAGYTLEDVWTRIKKDGSFSYLSSIAPATAVDEDKRELEYHFLLSTVAACLLIYLLISYCLSLGFRVIKLAFYELIAPLPIMASILPNQKGMLEKWIKATLSTFLEVFIRIAILYFAVYILDFLGGVLNGTGSEAGMFEKLGVDGLMKYTIYAIIIMGVVTFVKQAPNLISEITGISSEHTKFGIKEQLKNGGFFTAGAMAGGAATGLIRNAKRLGKNTTGSVQRFKDTKGKGFGKRAWAAAGVAGTALLGAGRMVTGAASGGISGIKNSKDVSSWSGIKNAAHDAGESVETKYARKDKKSSRYRANGNNFITGRFIDFKDSAKDWVTGGSQAYSAASEDAEKVLSAVKEYETAMDEIMSKFDNVKIISKMTEPGAWKGKTGAQLDFMKNKLEYYRSKNMGFKEIRADIDLKAKKTDFASEDERATHAKELSWLEDMYKFANDQSKIELGNAIGSGSVSTIESKGISSENVGKLSNVKSKFENVEQVFANLGSTITYTAQVADGDNIVEKRKTITGMDTTNVGNSVDQIKKAYEELRNESYAKAQRAKEKAEARKNDK